MIKKYIVTLVNHDVLNEFISDMETENTDKLFIPKRKVFCFSKIDNCRILTYELTKEESLLLKQDNRVLDVEDEEIHFRFAKSSSDFYEIDKNFYKNYWNEWFQEDLAWSLWRATSRTKSSDFGWGNSDLGYIAYGSRYVVTGDGIGSPFNFTSAFTGYEGQHVDIVIMDSTIDPNHPEIALNSDGTGGTRYTQYPWYQGYTYTVTNDNDDHGMNSAGVSAGNTCGFARRSNVYGITVFSGNQGTIVDSATALSYVRNFHLNKPINPVTGRKNPTVANFSGVWSRSDVTGSYTNITSVKFNGTIYNGPFTRNQILEFGISLNGDNLYRMPFFSTSHTTAVTDFLDLGNTYFFCSAGNDDRAAFRPGHPYYDNYLVYSGITVFYNRMSSFNDGNNRSIVSGALSFVTNERKAKFSNKGNRIDIWSIGEGCKASSFIGKSNGPPSFDHRNNNYTFKAYGGTSCASPVTAGIGACAISAYPDKLNTQEKLRDFLNYTSTKDIITETGSGTPLQEYSGGTGAWEKTNFGLWNAPNSVVYLYPARYAINGVYPRKNNWLRPIQAIDRQPNSPVIHSTTGLVYPRRIVRYGKP